MSVTCFSADPKYTCICNAQFDEYVSNFVSVKCFSAGPIYSDELHPVQQAVVHEHATQCGFCTPGFIMSAYALLMENPTPTRDEIRHAIAGNLCRCTGYIPITNAIEKAAKTLAK